MIRCWLFLVFVIGSGAAAVAAIAPGTASDIYNGTVVEKNQSWEAADSVTTYNCPTNGCEIATQGY